VAAARRGVTVYLKQHPEMVAMAQLIDAGLRLEADRPGDNRDPTVHTSTALCCAERS
jgi:hypothetical protein